MDFIKKNIVLSVILTLTLLVSAFLIFLDWQKQNSVFTVNRDITNMTIEIHEYNNKSPAPVAENLEMFAKDTSLMKERTQDLQRVFGKPFRYPLLKFAEILNIQENDLLNKFRDYCISKATVNDNNALLNGFLESLDNPIPDAQPVLDAQPAEAKEAPKKAAAKPASKAQAAKQAFLKAANERIPGSVTEANVNDTLLQALGVPMTMFPTLCKEYIIRTQENFAKNYSSIFGVAQNADSYIMVNTVAKLTFDYQSRVPANEEITPIIRKLQMFDDLFWRLKESNITQLGSSELLGSPLGDDAGVKGFTKFSYRIKFTSSLPGVRALVNSLVKAPLDNRYYNIKDFSIQGNDEIPRANALLAAQTSSATIAFTDISAMQGGMLPMPGAGPAAASTNAEIPPENRPDYGIKLIGDSKIYICTIEFDYYIYVGDELKR